LKIANDSGFPLQIAVEHVVAETSSQHGWRVRYTEHSWVNRLDDQSGFIDLVLQHRDGNTCLVLECKRVREATWLFLHSDGAAKERRHAKSWVSRYSDGQMKFFGWNDVPVDPSSPEALFCSVRGQTSNDKRTMLERIGGELISATEALAQEERDFRPQAQEMLRFYFNVIVTTAELKVAKFSPKDISLPDGTLASAEINDVPFVRFRKQMSMRGTLLTPDDYENGLDPAYAKENTVFVVGADALLHTVQNEHAVTTSRGFLLVRSRRRGVDARGPASTRRLRSARHHPQMARPTNSARNGMAGSDR
jgi:hypothetical protein